MTIDRDAIIALLNNKVKNLRILVIGDVMLDQYFYGTVTRISQEAPVPINLVKGRKDKLGGVANVAHNLVTLGCQVNIYGIVGRDEHGSVLKDLLKSVGINVDGLNIEETRKTTTKARILGNRQQMLRLDFEDTDNLQINTENIMLESIKLVIKKGVDAVILSDYKKGTCTPRLCHTVISYCNLHGIPILVDPKGSDWQKYSGADYITPNMKELSEVADANISNEDDGKVLFAARNLIDRFLISNILVTRSEKGITYVGQSNYESIPTKAQEVFDVSGAGDTVIAAFCAGIAGGLNISDAAYMANLAAGIGVGKVGTYAVSREEIVHRLVEEK